jgi:hypothetical protein
MNKEFVPYEQAVALKDLGFDEPCIAFYDAYNGDSHLFFKLRGKSHWLLRVINAIRNKQEQSVIETSQYHLEYLEGDNAVLAPLKQQAFSWFREKCRLQPSVNSFCFEEYSFVIMGSRNEILYPIQHKLLNDGKKNPWEFDTYEEAELTCLIKLIDIVKEK